MKRKLILALVLGLILAAGCLSASAAGGTAEISRSMTLEEWAARPVVETAALQDDGDWEKARDILLEAALNWKDTANVLACGITMEQLDSLFFDWFFRHPELFYLDSGYECSCFIDGAGNKIVTEVRFGYSKGYTREDQAVYNAAVEQALRSVPEGLSQVETVAAFHDWLAARCAYDYDFEETSWDAYGALVNGKAVCQGYSQALIQLLQRRGIDTAYVSSEETNHGWIQVLVDGEWYHVDVTLDDPAVSYGGSRMDVPGRVLHQNLLRSDEGIRAAHTFHQDWEASAHPCTSTKYDGWFWQEITSRMIFPGDGICWYMRNDALYQNSVTGGAEQCLDSRTAGERWYIWGGGGSYSGGNQSALAHVDGVLYFTGPAAVYSYDPATGAAGTLYTYTGGKGWIYGMREENDGSALILWIRQSPGGADQEVIRIPLEKPAPKTGIDSVTVEGSRVTVQAAGPDGGKLLCGVYDAGGRMTGVRTGVPKDGGVTFDFTGTAFTQARAFLLDGAARPLCESK